MNRILENYAFLDYIKARFNLNILIFSQPDVSTHYNLDLLRYGGIKYKDNRSRLINDFYEPLWNERPDIIRLDHLFNEFGTNRRAIIDDCHYSPEFNELLAEKVAEHVWQIEMSIPKKKIRPTGKPRNLWTKQTKNID